MHICACVCLCLSFSTWDLHFCVLTHMSACLCACWMDGCGMGGGGIPLKVWGLGQLNVHILLPCGRGLEVIFVLTTNILVSTLFFARRKEFASHLSNFRQQKRFLHLSLESKSKKRSMSLEWREKAKLVSLLVVSLHFPPKYGGDRKRAS